MASDEEHLASHVRSMVHECRSRRNLASEWWAYWKHQGCEILDAADAEKVKDGILNNEDRKALKEEKINDKNEITSERAARIAAVDTNGMTPTEARSILDRDHKPEEEARAQKTLIEDFYQRPVTPELILEDDLGRTRQRVRRFNAVRAVAQGGDALEKLLTKDEKSARGGVTATGRNEALRAVLAWNILAAAGVTARMLEPDAATGGFLGQKNGINETDVTGDSLNINKPPRVAMEDQPDHLNIDRLSVWLRRADVRRQLKLHLGLDSAAWLGERPGKRKRKKEENATGGSLDINKKPYVTNDGLFHDPFIENMSEEKLAALFSDSEKSSPQPMRFVAAVARQIGLKFDGKQSGAGSMRGRRFYRLNKDSISKMFDFGAADWARLNGLPLPDTKAPEKDFDELNRIFESLLDVA